MSVFASSPRRSGGTIRPPRPAIAVKWTLAMSAAASGCAVFILFQNRVAVAAVLIENARHAAGQQQLRTGAGADRAAEALSRRRVLQPGDEDPLVRYSPLVHARYGVPSVPNAQEVARRRCRSLACAGFRPERHRAVVREDDVEGDRGAALCSGEISITMPLLSRRRNKAFRPYTPRFHIRAAV